MFSSLMNLTLLILLLSPIAFSFPSRQPLQSSQNQPMDKRRRKQLKTKSCHCSQEVSSFEWEVINMTEQEEDLIYRMHKLVGDRWGLIAGRLPGRKAEEIERFWLMSHSQVFASKSKPQ